MPKSTEQPKRKRGAQPANDNTLKSGFYSPHFTEEELSRIAAFIKDPTLDDEIFMLRTLNNRMLKDLNDEVPETTLAAALEVLTTSAGRVAKLLRDRRALSGERADSIAGAMAEALDMMRDAMGIDV